MGAGASSTTECDKLNSSQCAALAGSKFDQQLFDQLQDADGRVSMEQLIKAQLGLHENGRIYESGAHGSEDAIAPRDIFRAKPDTKPLWTFANEAELQEMKAQLSVLEESNSSAEKEMTVAAAASHFEAAARWKEHIEIATEQAFALKTGIHRIETQAWEPVVKGSTVLFYYNW
jgi:hypothetical protein